MSKGFSAFFLEMLNGGAVTPEFLWMVMIGVYLCNESKRRGLHKFDWLHLPAGMDFMVAIFVADAGIWIRSIVIWNWRRHGGGEFNEIEVAALIFGGALIFLGYLCKIRAWTEPDYGRGPWLLAAGLSAVALGVMLALH